MVKTINAENGQRVLHYVSPWEVPLSAEPAGDLCLEPASDVLLDSTAERAGALSTEIHTCAHTHSI